MNEKGEILEGLESIFSIEEYKNAKEVILITGKLSFTKSGAKSRIFERLRKEKSLQHLHNFSNNPKFYELIEALNKISTKNVDLIVAVGGGTILDYSKLIKCFMYSNSVQVSNEIEHDNRSIKIKDIPLIVIPSTAGTGSEATQFAVIYKDNVKYSVSDKNLLPNFIIHDADLPLSNSKEQKISQGLDTFAQAIESYWAVNSDAKAKAYSAKALELVMNNFLLFAGGSNAKSIVKNMQLASYFSGKAINIAKTTAPHAWSYYLSSHLDVSHGIAVWYTLPKVFDIHMVSKNFREGMKPSIHKKNMKQLSKLIGLNETKPSNFFNKYLFNLGLILDISNFQKTNRSTMLESANFDRMSNNPIVFNDSDQKYIFDLSI